MDKYKEYYQKKKLLPRAFLSGSRVEEIQGIYVTFWLYDGAVMIDAKNEASDEETKNNEHIVSFNRAVRRGTVSFSNVSADASMRMSDAIFAGKGSMRPVHNASQANDYIDKDVKLVRADDTFLRTEKRPLNQPRR